MWVPRSPAYGTRDVLEGQTLCYAKTGATDIVIPLFAPSFTDLEHMNNFFLPLTTDMESLTHLGREHVLRFRRFFTMPLYYSVYMCITCMDN